MKIIDPTTGVCAVELFSTLVGPNGITVAIFEPSGWPDSPADCACPCSSPDLAQMTTIRSRIVLRRPSLAPSAALLYARRIRSPRQSDRGVAGAHRFRAGPGCLVPLRPGRGALAVHGTLRRGLVVRRGLRARRDGFHYPLGRLDGAGAGLLAAAAMAKLPERSARSYPSLLLLQGAILGAYMALDLPLFVLCSALMVASLYPLVRSRGDQGSVGSPRRLALLEGRRRPRADPASVRRRRPGDDLRVERGRGRDGLRETLAAIPADERTRSTSDTASKNSDDRRTHRAQFPDRRVSLRVHRPGTAASSSASDNEPLARQELARRATSRATNPATWMRPLSASSAIMP